MKKPTAFISHGSRDKPFVRRLAKDLEDAGLGLWVDERELQVGDSVVGGISAGLSDSDYLIVVLSQASANSSWVTAELSAAFMDQMTGQGTVVLPALIEDCRLPPLLRDRVYADFRGEYDIGLAALLAVLSLERKPPPPPVFRGQGCETTLRALAPADLRRRLEKLLSRDDLRVLWHATLNTDMEDDMRSSKLQICALELVLRCQRLGSLESLHANVCLDFPHIAQT